MMGLLRVGFGKEDEIAIATWRPDLIVVDPDASSKNVLVAVARINAECQHATFFGLCVEKDDFSGKVGFIRHHR